MRLINICFIQLILFSFSVAHAQVTEYTLQQCIQIAVTNNLQLRQGEANVQLNKNAVRQSKLILLPNLNFSASYYMNFGKSIDYVSYQYVYDNFQSNNFSLISNLSLFQGGIKNNTIKQATYNLETSQLDQQSLQDNIKLYVVMGYLQVMFALDQLKIEQNKKATSTLQLQNSQKLVTAGSIPEGNLLSLEAQIAADEVTLVSAQNQLDLAYLDLKNLMQLPPQTEIKIVYPDDALFEEIFSAPVADEQSVINTAVALQPGIKKYESQLKSDNLGIKIAQGYGLPSLTLSGSAGTNYSDVTYGILDPDPYAKQINNNLGEVLGLSLNVPIFNNGQVILNRQDAEIKYLNTQLQQQIAINDLKKSVAQAVTNLKAAIASYSAAKKSYEAAQKAFEFAEKKFSFGKSGSLDYTIAQNNMEQAAVALSQAKFDLIFKSKVVDYYLGKPITF